MLGKRVRWTRALMVGMALSLAIVGQSCSRAKDKESVEEIESRRHHFRVVGEVEFEGERIVYDEVIQVRIDVGYVSTMGLVKGDNRRIFSRLWVKRVLRSGGVLFMEVPDAAGLFADLEHPDQPHPPRWTPSYIQHYLRPPAEFLPEFLWLDRASDPTVIEGYLSEAYYAQAAARLRVVAPIRIEYVARTPEIEAIALAQKQSEPLVEITTPDGTWWHAPLGYSVTFTQLRQLAPEIAVEIDEGRTEGFSVLSKEASEALFAITGRDLRFAWGYRTRGDGVPQPKKYPDGHGILYRKWAGLTMDEGQHISCNLERRECILESDVKGFVSFYRANFREPGWILNLGQDPHEMIVGRGLVDYQQQRVVLVGELGF